LAIGRNGEAVGDEELGDADTHVTDGQDADFDAFVITCSHFDGF
jgi:hypothetical protein